MNQLIFSKSFFEYEKTSQVLWQSLWLGFKNQFLMSMKLTFVIKSTDFHSFLFWKSVLGEIILAGLDHSSSEIKNGQKIKKKHSRFINHKSISNDISCFKNSESISYKSRRANTILRLVLQMLIWDTNLGCLRVGRKRFDALTARPLCRPHCRPEEEYIMRDSSSQSERISR